MVQLENEMLQLGVYALVVRGQGHDFLMGRNVHDYISVPGLENLLKPFILDLDQIFKLIYKNDIVGFLQEIQNKMKINIIEIKENLEHNLNEMKDTATDEVIIYYLVITKTLETLRQIVFDQEIWACIEKEYKKINNSPLPADKLKKLKNLDSSGENQDFSLLFNLMFIHHLAQIYQNSDILQKTQKIIEEKVLHLISMI